MGLEESFDLSKEWRLDPRRDKPDRFVLNRINKSPTGTKTITLKAETKEEADGWIEILAKVQAGMSVAKTEKETPHAAAARQAAAAAADVDEVDDVAATFAGVLRPHTLVAEGLIHL